MKVSGDTVGTIIDFPKPSDYAALCITAKHISDIVGSAIEYESKPVGKVKKLIIDDEKGSATVICHFDGPVLSNSSFRLCVNYNRHQNVDSLVVELVSKPLH